MIIGDIMKVCLLISKHSRIEDYKKILNLVDDLIKRNIYFYLLNFNGMNKLILDRINMYHYQNYHCLNINDLKTSELIKLVNNYNFDKIVVCGLKHFDQMTKLIDEIIGNNWEIYVLPSKYGILSDSSKLINDGAYYLGSIYDLI